MKNSTIPCGHVRSNLVYLVCLRLVFRLSTVTKNRFPLKQKCALSYQLIQVQWLEMKWDDLHKSRNISQNHFVLFQRFDDPMLHQCCGSGSSFRHWRAIQIHILHFVNHRRCCCCYHVPLHMLTGYVLHTAGSFL